MPKNEDGEFELILGNRQLLSVFFIVVVLLGVFFTMGYIVGRNSRRSAAEVASVHKPDRSRWWSIAPPTPDPAARTPRRPRRPQQAPQTARASRSKQPKPKPKPER